MQLLEDFMIDCKDTNKDRLIKAEKISSLVKETFNLTHIRISLNMFNDNINVELRQKENSKEVLLFLEQNFSLEFGFNYKIKHSPILSGSYVTNPNILTTALYNFERI